MLETSHAVPAFTCPSGQTSARNRSFRSGAQIDLHLSTLTIYRHFRAHARATCSWISPRSRTCSVTSFDDVHLSTGSTFRFLSPSNAETRRPRHLETSTTFWATVVPRCRALLEIFETFRLRVGLAASSDLARCSLNTLTARVHIQRIVIERVGSFVSVQAALLELLSLPTRPPGLWTERLDACALRHRIHRLAKSRS
jgi:hypothetical protein